MKHSSPFASCGLDLVVRTFLSASHCRVGVLAHRSGGADILVRHGPMSGRCTQFWWGRHSCLPWPDERQVYSILVGQIIPVCHTHPSNSPKSLHDTAPAAHPAR
jgi:hypothetical protein